MIKLAFFCISIDKCAKKSAIVFELLEATIPTIKYELFIIVMLLCCVFFT
jgi:hypothetical protein